MLSIEMFKAFSNATMAAVHLRVLVLQYIICTLWFALKYKAKRSRSFAFIIYFKLIMSWNKHSMGWRWHYSDFSNSDFSKSFWLKSQSNTWREGETPGYLFLSCCLHLASPLISLPPASYHRKTGLTVLSILELFAFMLANYPTLHTLQYFYSTFPFSLTLITTSPLSFSF